MKKFLFIIILFLFFPVVGHASGLAQKLEGRILLNTEENGEAWYVYPEDQRRYFLGRPADAFEIMRELGLGISEKNFQQIAQAGMPVEGDTELAERLAGRIVLRTEKHGEAWYINSEDLKKYYLGRPEDAFRIMRNLGLGVARLDLARIHKPGLDESLDEYSEYNYRKKVTTSKGDFYADIIKIDLDDPDLEIITDTANKSDCESDCPAQSLGEFVIENNGFAGVNATYFDTNSSKKNYYFFPVYNSELEKMINQDQLKYWTTGPIMAFDKENNFYYFKDSREFQSVDHFEQKYNTELRAALGNKPRLIEQGKNLLIEWDMDDKQRYAHSRRTALAYREEPGEKGELLVVMARGATVPDLADIMKAMQVDYALNLDGGNSASLFYNGEYMLGPGRDIPNALIFGKK